MKPVTLLVMAAGMGSRYGGDKQTDAFGPGGETLMEYSIHDAVQAGFDKVVFVIRRHMYETFRETITEAGDLSMEIEEGSEEVDGKEYLCLDDYGWKCISEKNTAKKKDVCKRRCLLHDPLCFLPAVCCGNRISFDKNTLIFIN